MAILATFFASCVSASRVQQVSDLRLKLALKPRHVWKYRRQGRSHRGGRGTPDASPMRPTMSPLHQNDNRQFVFGAGF